MNRCINADKSQVKRYGWVALIAVMSLALLGAWGVAQGDHNEAPQLAERVAAGGLDPVEARLPVNPRVLEPVERVGEYGGTWRSGLVGGGDTGWMARTIWYDFLVAWDHDWNEIIPNVAEDFEVNEDATEFTFYLREGMRWSDGEPFTSDDIVFWYEAVLTNSQLTPAPPGWMISGGEVLEVEALDDYTVVFRFAAPNGLFLQRLATTDGNHPTLYPRHYLEQYHIDYNPEGVEALMEEAGFQEWADFFADKASYDARATNTELPTLFPWVLTAPYDGTTTRVTAERNPYYWKVDTEGNQLPYLDRIVMDVFEDSEVLLLRALSGEIDLQDRHIATLDNRSLFVDNQEQGDYRFFDTVPAWSNSTVISLNMTHNDPVKREIFQNKDFRIGLSHAINRQELIDLIWFGRGEPFQAAPRPDSEFYHEQLARQYTEYDAELANEHLDRAGYSERDSAGYRLGPDGNRISFAVEVVPALRPEWVDVMELVQQYWSEVGIDMQIRTIDRSLFYTRKEANEHDANVWQGDGGLDVVLEPRWYFPFSHESNYAILWADWFMTRGSDGEEPPEAVRQTMELYRELQATGDLGAQADLMNEILDIAAEQFYVIGISLDSPGYGIVKNNFHNVPASMPNAWLYPHPGPTNPEQYFIEGGGN